ncbi:MAG: hypothetical protein NTW46_02670 [Candidatus Nealsonbacteria bacterium]|nr:hypothetical protein [Candidatus Nealsonbacteria bacterium]
MKLLQQWLKRAKAVDLSDGTLAPKSKVEKGEKVIGVLPDELKRFYAVYDASADELDAAHVQIEAEIDAVKDPKDATREKADDIALRHELCHTRHEIVWNFFWGNVRLAFPEIISERSIGIRKGWKVVVMPPPSLEQLTCELLMALRR